MGQFCRLQGNEHRQMRILLLTINLWIGVEMQVASAQSCAVELEKMNVVFTGGAINPLTIAISDLPDSVISVTPSFGEVHHLSNSGNYQWTICGGDSTVATLTICDKVRDTLIAIRRYRVKRAPEPTPVLGSRRHHGPRIGEFNTQSGLGVVLETFDFDMKCDIISYEMEYFKKRADPSPVVQNIGARFNERVQSYVNQAVPGDQYHFFNLKYTCGCDPLVRRLDEGLRFKIK